MSVSKVIYNGQTLIDLTSDTVTPVGMLQGVTAHGANGESITGTMTNRGAVSATINGGQSYTIPAGYHNGSGSVTANQPVLQTLEATPSETKQTFTPSTGVNGYSSVNVNPIPSNYKNIKSVNAAPAEVLSGKSFINNGGSSVTGTMVNRGAVTQTLNGGESYTIPQGYHTGTGTVTANQPSMTNLDVTPSESVQRFTSPTGYNGYNQINVAAIPSNYKNIKGVTASAGEVLSGKTFVNNTGSSVTGTMTNQGAVSATINGGQSYTIPAGYHNGSGKVTANQPSLKTLTATPTESQQSFTPETGYNGYSSVTVAAIPSNYKNIKSVTAAAGDVFTGNHLLIIQERV